MSEYKPYVLGIVSALVPRLVAAIVLVGLVWVLLNLPRVISAGINVVLFSLLIVASTPFMLMLDLSNHARS